MFTVATWNPTQGLGSAGDREKTEFVNGLEVDLFVVADYGKGDPTKGLDFRQIQCHGRVMIACREGEVTDGHPTSPSLPNFKPFCYRTKNGLELNCLGLYAATPVVKSHVDLNIALDLWSGWLIERPSILLGDFNMWSGLKGTTGATSSAIHRRLSGYGYSSAFHASTGVRIGRERINPGTHANPGTTTFEGSYGDFHIDYIFYRGLTLGRDGRDPIVHFPKGTKKYRGHSAVVASFKEAADA